MAVVMGLVSHSSLWQKILFVSWALPTLFVVRMSFRRLPVETLLYARE